MNLKYRIWDKIEETFITERASVLPDGSVLSHSYIEDWRTGDQDNYIIQLFTGLKNSKDKEIYEGDIVTNGYCCTEGQLCEIVFYKGMVFFKRLDFTWEMFLDKSVNTWEEDMDFAFGRTENCEIVGNILGNPEFLK